MFFFPVEFIISKHPSTCNLANDFLNPESPVELQEDGSFNVFSVSKGDWINSLNHLELRDVFLFIKKNGFMNDEGRINYPLFIYLKLRTNDVKTLDQVADIIQQFLGDILVSPKKYNNTPC